jgi:hypothetical protein
VNKRDCDRIVSTAFAFVLYSNYGCAEVLDRLMTERNEQLVA